MESPQEVPRSLALSTKLLNGNVIPLISAIIIIAKYSPSTLWDISTMFTPYSAHIALVFATIPTPSLPVTVITAFILMTIPFVTFVPKTLHPHVCFLFSDSSVFRLFDIAEIYILISLGTADFKLSRRLLHEIEKFSLKIADAENGYEFILDIRL